MENTSNFPISDRDVFYYRQRYKNRVFSQLVSFFVEEAERSGITKRDIAERLKRDPALISRWLNAPSNLTLETVSDLLLALGAEMDSRVARFSERPTPNFAHPLVERAMGLSTPKSTVTQTASGQPTLRLLNLEITPTTASTTTSTFNLKSARGPADAR